MHAQRVELGRGAFAAWLPCASDLRRAGARHLMQAVAVLIKILGVTVLEGPLSVSAAPGRSPNPHRSWACKLSGGLDLFTTPFTSRPAAATPTPRGPSPKVTE